MDKGRCDPTRRLSADEIEGLAKEQAEGKIQLRDKIRKGRVVRKVTFVDSKGYPRISIRLPGLRDKRLHDLVAEAMIGRELQADETVHHRDGNYLNFHWNNLMILHSEDHGAVSGKQKYYFKIMGISVEKLKQREPGEDDDDY